jgi:hypothetical protein
MNLSLVCLTDYILSIGGPSVICGSGVKRTRLVSVSIGFRIADKVFTASYVRARHLTHHLCGWLRGVRG